MTPALKKVCILGLATGIGKMVVDQTSTDEPGYDTIIWNAKQMVEAGEQALDNIPVKVDMNMIRRSHKKIQTIFPHREQFDIDVALSFLFMGLHELLVYGPNENLQRVLDAVLNFLTVYDPNLEDETIHERARKDYEAWVK